MFYEDSNYSLAVKEFLDAYYHMDGDRFKNDGSLFFEEQIHGRCGYIRQAYPFIIKDYEFSKISLNIEGQNSMLSDLDYYDSVRRAVQDKSVFDYTVSLPAYFRKNPYLQHVTN